MEGQGGPEYPAGRDSSDDLPTRKKVAIRGQFSKQSKNMRKYGLFSPLDA